MTGDPQLRMLLWALNSADRFATKPESKLLLIKLADLAGRRGRGPTVSEKIDWLQRSCDIDRMSEFYACLGELMRLGLVRDVSVKAENVILTLSLDFDWEDAP